MMAFTFVFKQNPEGGEEPLRVYVTAESLDDAWQRVEANLGIPVETLKEYDPAVQLKELKVGEIVVSRKNSPTTYDSDNPWLQVVADGINQVTDAIRETIGGAQKDRVQVDLARLGIDRLVITVFSIAFLGSLLFAFYLIVIGNQDPLFKFIFPIITAVIGLISGYFAGRGSAGSEKR